MMKRSRTTNKIPFVSLIILTQFGSSVLGYLLSLNVLITSGSPLEFSKVILAGALTSITTAPIIGLLVDKYDKKILLVITQVTSIVFLVIFWLSSFKQSNLSIIWIILLIVVLTLCDSMVSTILLSSAVFMVETEEELNQFNGLQQSVDSSCSLLGPIIAAIIYPYVSIGFAIGVEIFLESLAIVAILFLRLHKKSIFNDTGEEFSSELSISSIIESIKYLFKDRVLLLLLIGMLSMNFLLSSLTVGFPTVIINYFPNNRVAIGILESSIPLGMILSGLFFAYKNLNTDDFKIIMLSWYTCGLSLICMGISIFALNFSILVLLIALILINLILGLALTAGKIPILTFFQKNIPSTQQGKIFSFLDVVIQISIPVGTVVYGILFEYFSVVSIFIISGAIIIFFVIITRKDIRFHYR